MIRTIAHSNGHKTIYKAPTRASLTQDIGDTGLVQTWGQIQDDFLQEWRGQEKVKRIDEMLRNSPVIAALRMAIEMPVRDISWQFISDQGEGDPRIELLNEALENMSHSWNDHIVDALLTPFYGWTMFTITYENVGGRMLWKKFKMLGHDTVMRWVIADDGGLEGLQQWPHLWPEPIPIERMLVYRQRKTRNNPEGESILRPAWTAWYYVKNIQQIEAIGIERNLAGLPVITPPQGVDPDGDDGDQAQLIIRNVRNDEQAGVVLPPPRGPEEYQRWHLELMAPSSAGKVMDTNMVISRYEKRMLMASLAQFLMLGQDSIGALATFEGASDFFTMAINTIAGIIAETFTKYAVSRLLKLNGLDDDGITLEHSPAGDIGLDVIGTFLQQAGTFVTWTPDDEVWLRSLARLPEKDADELGLLQEEERARKEANAQAMRDAMQRNQTQDNQQENNAADWYALDRNPNDDEARRFEAQWYDKAEGYFGKQKRRLLKSVKGQHA